MRFGSSAAVLALSLLSSVQASVIDKRSLWCYSTEALCDSQLNDCAFDSSTGQYCGNVTKRKRSQFCHDTQATCESELINCEYTADLEVDAYSWCGTLD